MITKYVAALAAGAALFAVSAPASAAVAVPASTKFDTANTGSAFSFTSDGATYTGYASTTVNDIGFAAFGFYTNDAGTGLPGLASVIRYAGGGLGVINPFEGSGADGQHTIDNNTRYDFVALLFNKAVNLTGMSLNAYTVAGNGPDKDAWLSYGTVPTEGATASTYWSTALKNAMSAPDGVLASSGVNSTAGKFGNLWIVGADRTIVTADRNDGFKLASVSVVAAPVPEPATWATMILGFGVAGAAMRRRRSTKVSFA